MELADYVSDAAGTMMVPEILLPEQWADANQATEKTPEQRLMLAVLQDALMCLKFGEHNPVARRRTLYREARQWIEFNKGDCSFDYVCEVLGINAEVLRKRCLAGDVTATKRGRTVRSSNAKVVPVRERVYHDQRRKDY